MQFRKLTDSTYIIQRNERGSLGLAAMPFILFVDESGLSVPDPGYLDYFIRLS
jgi:hypothetical protein